MPSNPRYTSRWTRTHDPLIYLSSFNPGPSLPPHVTHCSPYTTIGADITISYPPPSPSFNLDSPDVLQILSANADLHLQIFEKRKLCRGNKCDPATGTQIKGDAIIGDLLQRNMTLLPFAINPFGRLGPLAHGFLFGTSPTQALTFPPSRSHASEMHRRITSFPSPIGIFPHADHTWSTTRPKQYFGHSFTAPTPSITTLQHLGLCICKSFASHIRHASKKFCDQPTAHFTRRPDNVTVPPYADHPR